MGRWGRNAFWWALIGLLAVTSSVPASAQEKPLWSVSSAGPHEVGFKRLWKLDETRVWPRSASIHSAQGEVSRPIRIDVWYPATCEDHPPMPLRRYLEMESPGPAFDDLVFLTHQWDEYSYRGLAPDSTEFDRLMDTRTAACFGASGMPGPFPLIVYSAGWYNRTPDNTVLAEFLASHGFVVAAVPQTNPGLWTFDFTSDAASVEAQVRDLEVTVAALTSDAMVDRRRVIAMGYSTGGDVALLLQTRNPLIDAVIGLDASWSLGPDNDVGESPFFGPDKNTVPILAVRRPRDDAESDHVLERLMRAPRVVVEVPGSDHGSFGDDNIQRYHLGERKPEYVEAHAAVLTTVLSFLKALRSGDARLEVDALIERLRSHGLDAEYRPPEASGD